MPPLPADIEGPFGNVAGYVYYSADTLQVNTLVDLVGSYWGY